MQTKAIKTKIAHIKGGSFTNIIQKYEIKFLNSVLPRGTCRRNIYELGFTGGRILVNEGCGKFLLEAQKKILKESHYKNILIINNTIRSTKLTQLLLEDALIGKFVFPLNGLNEIKIFTTKSIDANSDLILTISQSMNGPVIRNVKISSDSILNNDFTSFGFKPIKNSAGKTFFFSLKSLSKPSAAVWYDSNSSSTKIQLFRKNKSISGSIGFQAHAKLKVKDPYEIWIIKNEPTKEELEADKEKSLLFKYRPKISIVTSVWNTEERWLKLAIESVLNQVYDNWELCIADGGSTQPYIKEILDYYTKKDSRIKVKFLTENRGIALNSNEALSLATGEFVAFLNHDGELAPFALFEVVRSIDKNPEVQFIYSDRDKITEKGLRFEPFFKPDWSPDYLLSQNYLCHLNVVQKDLLDEVGWFIEGYDESQDYDLFLRITEKTNKIVHIPKILYHQRTLSTYVVNRIDVKPDTTNSSLKALQSAVNRRGWPAIAAHGMAKGLYRVKFQLEPEPKVSIIIPTKDKSGVLKKCIDSILNKTTYKNYEVIIIDNLSTEQKTFDYYEELEAIPNVRLFKYEKPFNFSEINNYAVSKTDSEYILFLNNDTEIITKNWIELMAGFACRRDTGAVGVKLIYPNGRIQHAGLILDESGNVRRAHNCYRQNSLGYAGRIQSIQNVSAVAAACMMVRRKVFDEIGGFNPRFAVAHGDIDFCLKLIDKHYLIVYEPHVELYHHESLSRGLEDTPEKVERRKKENDLFLGRWGHVLKHGDRYSNPNLTVEKEDFSIRI